MRLHQNISKDHCRPSGAARLLGQFLVQWTLALVVSALVLSPHTLVAQTAPAPQTQAPASSQDSAQEDADDEFFGAEHRRQIYEQSKLSTTTAVLYNLAVPGLGNIYAEQYFYGGIAFSLMVFTLVFVGYGFATDQSEFLWIGGGTAAIAYTGSIATSISGVRDYNEKLRQGLKLEGAFSGGPWGLPQARTVDLSFRF
jgi:hypothetical protein